MPWGWPCEVDLSAASVSLALLEGEVPRGPARGSSEGCASTLIVLPTRFSRSLKGSAVSCCIVCDTARGYWGAAGVGLRRGTGRDSNSAHFLKMGAFKPYWVPVPLS